MISLEETYQLVKDAHGDQVDKIGKPYIGHLVAVSNALAPFGKGMQMAGLLHDVIEDTDQTVRSLREAGVPSGITNIVLRVTKTDRNESYADAVGRAAGTYQSALLKIADNAHNSQPARLAMIKDDATMERLARKYRTAREILWAEVLPDDIRTVVRKLNPSLLTLLKDYPGGSNWPT